MLYGIGCIAESQVAMSYKVMLGIGFEWSHLNIGMD